jgi:CRISPR type III-B/RAMP module-associated protein Cmr5
MAHLTRDQKRAELAYSRVEEVIGDKGVSSKDYKVLINSLGANVIRSGLLGALCFMQRKDSAAVRALANHLSEGLGAFKIEGDIDQLVASARKLPMEDYMLATRELLALTVWFKRAVQALVEDES